MLEEVLPHKGVIAFWVVTGDADVLVHVESYDVLKRYLYYLPHQPRCTCTPSACTKVNARCAYLASLVLLNQNLVDAEGTRTGGKTKDEWMRRGWAEMLDAINDIISHVDAGLLGVIADDESHLGDKGMVIGGINKKEPRISVSWLAWMLGAVLSPLGWRL
jgi:hypothetical protein